MKVVLLAGGLGSRISEESYLRPKPMIEIGEKPILWHIMKIYSHYGFNEFVICLGYKGHMIKEFFANYYLHMSDITFDFQNNNQLTIHQNVAEPWKVTLVDTGLHAQTGARIKKIQKHIGDAPFFLTYGDGVSDVNIRELLDFHQSRTNSVTMTAVQPTGRFGLIDINEDNIIERFQEKVKEDGGWINGGFMVCEPEVFDTIPENDDSCIFEQLPLTTLATAGKLNAYRHHGFWQCMDTQRDKSHLENLWDSGSAPWKLWG